MFVFLVETRFHHVGQADLELLTSGDLPATAPGLISSFNLKNTVLNSVLPYLSKDGDYNSSIISVVNSDSSSGGSLGLDTTCL